MHPEEEEELFDNDSKVCERGGFTSVGKQRDKEKKKCRRLQKVDRCHKNRYVQVCLKNLKSIDEPHLA